MNDWRKTTLGEIASWSGGLTPSKSNPAYWEGGTIPWLSSKEVTGGVVRATKHKVTEAAVRETSLRLIPADAVAVVVRSGILLHTFPVALVPFGCTVNQDVKIGVPAEVTSASFLRLLLEFHASGILDRLRKTGTTVQSIDVPGLLRWPVCLPPPAEQRRIVDLVASLDAQMAALQEEVGAAWCLLRQLRETLFAHGPAVPLQEVCSIRLLCRSRGRVGGRLIATRRAPSRFLACRRSGSTGRSTACARQGYGGGCSGSSTR